MRININGDAVPLTEEVRTYFNKCMEKVRKLIAHDSEALIDAHFSKHVSHEAGEQFYVEVTVTGAGLHAHAESRERTLHAAIDVVESHLTQELRKNKGKRLDVVRRQAGRLKNFFKGFRE